MKNRSEAAALAKHISACLGDYVPSQKSGSANTLKAYQDSIGLYLQFLEQGGVSSREFDASCFGRDRIEQWLSWLRTERGCQPGTCNNRLASIRTFLKYLGHKEVRFLHLYQESMEIDRLKVQKKKVEGLSRPAVKALLAAPDQGTAMGRRDLVLMLVLYSTAARIDEVLSMKVGQLHLDSAKPYVNIIGKGNKVRTLYLLPRTVAHLEKYLLDFHGNTPSPEAYVFYSRNTGIYGKLTAAAADKMFKKHAVKAHGSCADVPLKLHAHQFRHAKASHWLEDGMNIVQISFLLGHEQLDTTMVYLDITTEDEAKALATLEGEGDSKVEKKWKNRDGSLREFCGLPAKRS